MTISGRSTFLRLVEVADAAFIFELRKSPRGRHLSPIGDDPRAQEEWIRSYKAREARSEEYYFVIAHRRAGDVGTLRIHDVGARSFWWGSWIVRQDAPGHAAFESMFLVYELGFFAMKLERAHFVVRKSNPSLGLHAKVGARITAEDDSRVFFELTRESYLNVRPRLTRRFSARQPPAAGR